MWSIYWWPDSRMHGKSRPIGRRSLTSAEFVVKSTGIAVQDGFPSFFNIFRMKRSVVTSLTFTLGTTGGAQGKALAVQLQTTD
jgi:uncharacterized protein (DUF1684 family)